MSTFSLWSLFKHQKILHNTRGGEHLERKDFDRANVVKEEIQQQDTRFLAVYVEAKNSIMIMLSEK